jgi:hypothetical protein
VALNADGSFTYTPAADFTGNDSFTYHVHDVTSTADSNVTLVTIAVRAAGASPTANNDSYTTDQGSSLTGSSVLANDSPLSGLTAALVSGPVYGALTFYPDGAFTYTQGPDFSNRDSFIYRATSGSGASNLARATIRVREQSSTSVSSTANPSVWGESVSFTATVSPATATGTVQFKIDGVNFGGPVALVNGTATSGSTSTLSVNTHNVSAVYGGDDEFVGSTGLLTQTVNKADTTTTITGDTPDPSKVGEPYSVSFTVTAKAPGAGTPTGNVTVSDGATSCTATVAAGSCSLTSTTAGSKTLVATYAGDTNFNGSTSAGASHYVAKADTTTAIISDSPDPSVTGQAYTINFSVNVNAPGAGTPTGNVTISDGTNSCTGTVASGTCSLTSTTAGMKTLTATYAGDSNFNGSAGTASHQVNKANTSTTITSDTPDPSVTGQPYTVSVSVAAVAPGTGTPTGSVSITDGTGATCTITLSGGAGSCSMASSTAGAKSLVATYASDANFNGSTSVSEPHTVNKANTTTTIGTVTPEPSVVGQSYTVSVSVSAASPGAGTPSGSVTVSDGTGGTCTVAALSGGAGSCSLTSTSYGAKTLTATYGGDSNFNGSAGTKAHQVNQAATTTTIGLVNPEPSLLGQPYSVPFTVTVNAPGAGAPTGTVTVSDGTGNTCTAAASTGACTLPSLTVGAKTLTATYSGDTNFATSTGTKVHNILYTFIGFLSPVDNLPTMNTGKAGRTYPVKWQLKDSSGAYITTLGAIVNNPLRFRQIMCDGSAPQDALPADTSGASGLRYDTTANQYIFTWQTAASFAGNCYELMVDLNDGTQHIARFKFTK